MKTENINMSLARAIFRVLRKNDMEALKFFTVQNSAVSRKQKSQRSSSQQTTFSLHSSSPSCIIVVMRACLWTK